MVMLLALARCARLRPVALRSSLTGTAQPGLLATGAASVGAAVPAARQLGWPRALLAADRVLEAAHARRPASGPSRAAAWPRTPAAAGSEEMRCGLDCQVPWLSCLLLRSSSARRLAGQSCHAEGPRADHPRPPRDTTPAGPACYLMNFVPSTAVEDLARRVRNVERTKRERCRCRPASFSNPMTAA